MAMQSITLLGNTCNRKTHGGKLVDKSFDDAHAFTNGYQAVPTHESRQAEQNLLADHYSSVAAVYDSAWCYLEDGPCNKHLCDHVMATLPNARGDSPLRICDVGCGTGAFTALLRRKMQESPKAVVSSAQFCCVEPAASMAQKAVERGFENVVVSGAWEWAINVVEPMPGGSAIACNRGTDADAEKYDLIILKEVRHHIDNPGSLYEALVTNRLNDGGRILVITRPDDSRNYYPFPSKAHEAWAQGINEPLEKHIEAFRAVGLSAVATNECPFRVIMENREWVNMLRAKFWSNLSVLSDAEMEDGIRKMNLDQDGNTQFDDMYLFLVGTQIQRVETCQNHLADHYSNVAAVYDSAWCYLEEGPCNMHLCAQVMATIYNAEGDSPLRICDVGCGTGAFTALLRRKMQESHKNSLSTAQFCCVEPAASMAQKAVERGFDNVVVSGAWEWAINITQALPGGSKAAGTAGAVAHAGKYDIIILKEVRHHIDNPGPLYEALVKNRLNVGGRIIVITRPDDSSSYYPFPKKAHDAWSQGINVPLEKHIEAFRAAGLGTVRTNECPFRVIMENKEWATMLRAKFWSNLSVLSDAEMESGIREMNLDQDGQTEFDDMYLFMIGNKY